MFLPLNGALGKSIRRGWVLAVDRHLAQPTVLKEEFADLEILEHRLGVLIVVEQYAVLWVVAPDVLHLVDEKFLDDQVHHPVALPAEADYLGLVAHIINICGG